MEWYWQGKIEVLGGIACPIATSSTTNPTWTVLGFNLGIRGDRPTTARTAHRLLWAAIAQSVWRLATGWTVRGSDSGGSEIFHTRPDRLRSSPSLLHIGYRVSFRGIKRPGRGVNHPPQYSAEVKERVELCHYSVSGPSWPVLGRTLPLLSPSINTPGTFPVPACEVYKTAMIACGTKCILLHHGCPLCFRIGFHTHEGL